MFIPVVESFSIYVQLTGIDFQRGLEMAVKNEISHFGLHMKPPSLWPGHYEPYESRLPTSCSSIAGI